MNREDEEEIKQAIVKILKRYKVMSMEQFETMDEDDGNELYESKRIIQSNSILVSTCSSLSCNSIAAKPAELIKFFNFVISYNVNGKMMETNYMRV